MPQFDHTFFVSQLVWLAITFTVLYLVLSRIALPRLAEVMDQRSSRLAADLDRAESLRREADAVAASL